MCTVYRRERCLLGAKCQRSAWRRKYNGLGKCARADGGQPTISKFRNRCTLYCSHFSWTYGFFCRNSVRILRSQTLVHLRLRSRSRVDCHGYVLRLCNAERRRGGLLGIEYVWLPGHRDNNDSGQCAWRNGEQPGSGPAWSRCASAEFDRRISIYAPAHKPNVGRSVASMSCGQYHTCALLTDGNVVCWGFNQYGQLGIGSTTSTTTTALMNSLPNVLLAPGLFICQQSKRTTLQWHHDSASLRAGFPVLVPLTLTSDGANYFDFKMAVWFVASLSISLLG